MKINSLVGLVCFLIPVMVDSSIAGNYPNSYTHQIVDESENRPVKPYIKLLGDISGDGKLDIVVASAKGSGAVWYSYPDWKREAIRTKGTYSEEGKLADMDRDGDLDIILPGPEGVFWYENGLKKGEVDGVPGGAGWPEHYIGSDGTNVHDLSVADLDKDGYPEIVVRYEKEKREVLLKAKSISLRICLIASISICVSQVTFKFIL